MSLGHRNDVDRPSFIWRSGQDLVASKRMLSEYGCTICRVKY